MKAQCNKAKVELLLDGRQLKWLPEKLKDIGISIEYGTFLHLINNRNEWKLTYAMGVSQVLGVKVEDIFVLQ